LYDTKVYIFVKYWAGALSY